MSHKGMDLTIWFILNLGLEVYPFPNWAKSPQSHIPSVMEPRLTHTGRSKVHQLIGKGHGKGQGKGHVKFQTAR